MIFHSASDAGFESTRLYQYRDAIRKGEIVAGHELIDILDMLIDQIGDRGTYYDTAEPERIFSFFKHCVFLTKSPFYGRHMELLFWQQAFIEVLFGTKMENGHDRFQRALLLVARKAGKTEMTAGLLLYMMMMGGYGLEIVCSSCNDRASGILYKTLDTMRVLIDPKSEDTWRNVSSIRSKIPNNQVFRLSDSARAKEGYNIDFAVVDEAHELADADVVSSIEQSQSTKEDPKLVIITSEGFVIDGFLDKELERARSVVKGEAVDPAAFRYLPWLYTVDSEADVWQGTRENRRWEKANPSLGPIKQYSYMEQQVERAKISGADRTFVFAKDFNIKQSNATAWLKREDYTYEYPEIDWSTFRDRDAVGGVDVAENTDLTCARILLPDEGHMLTLSHYWIPRSKLEHQADKSTGAKYEEWADRGWLTIVEEPYMDSAIVADWYWDIYDEYGIFFRGVGYDYRFAKPFAERCQYHGFTPELVWQNAQTLHAPYSMLEADLRLGRLWGLTEIDQWCLGNAALQVDSKGMGMLVKIRGQAARRIDGAVTLGIAYAEYMRHKAILEEG